MGHSGGTLNYSIQFPGALNMCQELYCGLEIKKENRTPKEKLHNLVKDRNINK